MMRHPAAAPRYDVLYEPTTLAIIATAATVAGTAVSVAGAIQQGNAASSASEYNATVARNNAIAAQQQAQQAAEAQQRQSAQVIGAARAGYGASGVTAEGSPLDVLSSSASNAELDRQNLLYRGKLAAAGYSNEADLDTARGQSAQQQALFGAGGALLKGGASTYSSASGLLAGSGTSGGGSDGPLVPGQIYGQ